MEQIVSALIVMVVGMAFVIGFLLIQVLVTLYGAKLAEKYAYLLPEPTKAAKKPAAPAASPADTEIAAVIAAALRQAGKI